MSAEAVADLVGPAPPQALSATADEDNLGQVVLRWTAPETDADGGSLTGLDNYVVLRVRDSSGSLSAIATLDADSLSTASGTLGSGVVQHVDTGLDVLASYTYTVVAVDADGNQSDQATPAQVQTAGISAPTGVTATAGNDEVTITWQASSEQDLIGYNVYRSNFSNGNYSALAGDGTGFTAGQTTFTNTNLTTGQVWFYRVSAVTDRGEGEQSGFVSAEVQ